VCVRWLVSLFLFLLLFFVCWYSVGGKFNCVTSSSAIAGIPGKNKRTRTLFSLAVRIYLFSSLSIRTFRNVGVQQRHRHTHTHTHARAENGDQLVICTPLSTWPEGCWLLMTELCHAASFERGTCERPVTGKATSLVDNSFRSLMVFPPFSLIRLSYISFPFFSFFFFSNFHSLRAKW
jgi:hypothetical protein